MMSRPRSVLTRLRVLPRNPAIPSTRRCLSATPTPAYDGVYKELTAMKLQKPWLRALKERNAGLADPKKPAPPQDLAPKRMKDSYHSLVHPPAPLYPTPPTNPRQILPLSRDEWLVDTYVNSSGLLRLGTLFQDLDALAGVISYKHAGFGPTIVTAAVDRIAIINPLEEWCDLQLSGLVSYVGRSSMEISLEARRVGKDGKVVEGHEGLLLTCAFTMVARDPTTNKAAQVPPLILETEEEKAIFQRGELYKTAKKGLAMTDLSKQTPNDEESDLIHQLWMEQGKYKDPQSAVQKPDTTIYMSESTINSTSIMQPQYRNRHSFMIFGGYLMKQTMELAFCCCSAFTHTRPRFLSLDPSTFLAPVPVGSILYLDATVAYTERGSNEAGTRVQVRVESKVKDVAHGKICDTGVFNYTFYVDKKLDVMPRTYTEFIKYVDARRRSQQQKELGIVTDDGTASRVTE